MSILLTQTAQEDVKGSPAVGALTLVHIVSLLEKLDPNNLEQGSKVHRIRDVDEEIYVLRERGVRVFFTKRDNDIVILSITNG